MIVSASFRNDIPAHCGAWFLRRLDAGFALVTNPYGGPDYRVSLARGEADGFVFWTRNAAPFLPVLNEVKRREFPFFVQFTITCCPRLLREIARRFGPRAAVWRYDPIVASDATPAAWHRENFARLARALGGASDEAVISFVAPYRKTARNLAAALGRARRQFEGRLDRRAPPGWTAAPRRCMESALRAFARGGCNSDASGDRCFSMVTRRP